jgi:hypothetical protein
MRQGNVETPNIAAGRKTPARSSTRGAVGLALVLITLVASALAGCIVAPVGGGYREGYCCRDGYYHPGPGYRGGYYRW